MASKTWVETRVKKLLDKQFAWTYKPVDAGPNGGATKLDVLVFGGYLEKSGGVEVKQTDNKGFYNPLVTGSSGISAGQRAALEALVRSRGCIAWVAVWSGPTCYWYDWRDMWTLHRWEWTDAFEVRTFRTWAEWLATPVGPTERITR